MRAGFFFPGNRDRTRGSGLKLCQGRLMLNIREKFQIRKREVLERAAQEGSEVTVPGGFQGGRM